MIRCKACGFIMNGANLKDKCPACGAPKTAFEPYEDPMSLPRRRFLNFHLHPIAVHFPTTFVTAALVLSVALLFFSGDIRTLLLDADKITSLLVPAVGAIAFAVGWLDGKVRFRKIKNSRILKQKILYASFLLAVSTGQAVTIWLNGFTTFVFSLAAILLGAIAFALVFILALLGMSILGAAFPGK